MQRLTLTASLALAVVVPATASAQLSHSQTTAYGRAYAHVVMVYGKTAAGCKLIGPHSTCHSKATDAAILRSTDTLRRMFAPRPVYRPAPTHYATTVHYYHATGRSIVSGSRTYIPTPEGAAGVPACASESGTNYSTGPDNTNPSSGATGRYQIIPSTAAAYHCDLSTPAGQDACAGRIYRAAGASQWVGCGG